MTSIAAGEYAENEMRKDFTPSERVAIAEAIKDELGERRGGDQSKVPNRSQWSGKRTRQIAAERSGFGSPTSLARAEETQVSPQLCPIGRSFLLLLSPPSHIIQALRAIAAS